MPEYSANTSQSQQQRRTRKPHPIVHVHPDSQNLRLPGKGNPGVLPMLRMIDRNHEQSVAAVYSEWNTAFAWKLYWLLEDAVRATEDIVEYRQWQRHDKYRDPALPDASYAEFIDQKFDLLTLPDRLEATAARLRELQAEAEAIEAEQAAEVPS
jgi:hypothetical protein